MPTLGLYKAGVSSYIVSTLGPTMVGPEGLGAEWDKLPSFTQNVPLILVYWQVLPCLQESRAEKS